jgi:hypothetical protein
LAFVDVNFWEVTLGWFPGVLPSMGLAVMAFDGFNSSHEITLLTQLQAVVGSIQSF